jgi:type IV pilus assembly protein PilV
MAERGSPTRTVGRPPAGFTLAEVLVALAVLAIGLLGAAALAVDTVQMQNRAALRAQAQRLSADLAERLRSNRAGLLAYGSDPAVSGCTATTTPGARCTPEELAREELALWRAEIRRILPQGRGALTLATDGQPARYAIVVSWRWRDRNERVTVTGRL